MLKYKPIAQLTVSNNQVLNEPTDLDLLIQKFDKLFSDAGDNELKRRDMIYLACSELLKHRESAREIFIEHFTETFKWLKKRDITSRLYKIKKKNSEDDNDNQVVVIPEVDKIENYIIGIIDIRYNIISNKYESKFIGETNGYDEFNEYNLLRKLRKKHIEISVNYIRQIIKSNFTPNYNPIENYFKKLDKWDGQDHIEKFTQYILLVNENDRDRFNRHLKKMFVRIIAGAFGRTSNKRSLVFIGGQDSGKTWLLRWFVPNELKDYFTEDIDFRDKDALIAMSSNFLIIFDDLEKIPHNDLNTLKSVMSRDMMKIRLPYDRRESMLKRRSSFIASTNETDFLTDTTGNVRWICFYIKDQGINWNYRKDIKIDNIWAQAFYLFNNGFDYDLSKEELEENEFANMQFMVKSTESELIPRFYLTSNKEDEDVLFWQATDFYNDLNKRFEGTRLNLNLSNIGKALRLLKFKRVTHYDKEIGYSIWGYYIKIRQQAKTIK